MVSRAFTFAGIATFMGAVIAAGAAGCTNDDDGVTATDVDAGTTDAARDRFVPPTGGDDDDEPDESCAAKDPIDVAKIPYAKALRSPGACSSDEVAALAKYFSEQDPGNLTVSDWAATVSESCAACAFTPLDAEVWGPLLVEGDKLAGVNRGGCIELESKSEACGRAYEQVITCMIVMCLPPAQGGSGTCSTQAAFNACRDEVVGTGPCAEPYAAVERECGSNLADYEKACTATGTNQYGFEATIPAHCGGTADADADAGADGG